MLVDERIVHHITTLNLHWFPVIAAIRIPPDTVTDLQSYKKNIEDVVLQSLYIQPEDRMNWSMALSRGDPDYVLAILVSLLFNLRRLSVIGEPGPGTTRMIRTIVEQKNQGANGLALNQLEYADVGDGCEAASAPACIPSLRGLVIGKAGGIEHPCWFSIQPFICGAPLYRRTIDRNT